MTLFNRYAMTGQRKKEDEEQQVREAAAERLAALSANQVAQRLQKAGQQQLAQGLLARTQQSAAKSWTPDFSTRTNTAARSIVEEAAQRMAQAALQRTQGAGQSLLAQAPTEPKERQSWTRKKAEDELSQKYGGRAFKDLSMEEQDRYLEDEDNLWDRQQEILAELDKLESPQVQTAANNGKARREAEGGGSSGSRFGASGLGAKELDEQLKKEQDVRAEWNKVKTAVETPAEKTPEQKLADLTTEYNALKDADEAGSTYGYTDAQADEAERRVDERETYEQTVARVGISAAIGERQRMVNEELAAMTKESRARREEEILAEDPEAAKVYNTAHNAGRLEKVFNPFDNRSELLYDLMQAESYGKGGTVPGGIPLPALGNARAADAEINGGLAARTAESIRKRMAYQDDPEKALADVRADLAELRRLKQTGAYNKDRLQEWIWQQEKQEQILTGYIAAKDKTAAAEGREKYLATLSGADKEYAEKYGVSGGTSLFGHKKGSGEEYAAGQVYAIAQQATGRQPSGDMAQLMAMSDAERAGFYALYATDPEAAQKYLSGMRDVTGERWSDLNERLRDYRAGQQPVLSGVLEEMEGLVAEAEKPLASAAVVGTHLTGGQVQRYGWAEETSTRADKNAARLEATISQAMTDKGYSPEQIELATAGYKILHNTLSNVSRNVTLGVAGAPSWLSTALMAFGTIGGTYYSTADSTDHTTQAQRMAHATGNAVSEFMTEALSDAHFFDALKGGAVSPGGSWWKRAGEAALHMIAGSGIETGTEVLNDVVSKEWENFILGEESAANRRLDAYYRQALAELFPNSPDMAMQWAQERAYKDSMAELWETAYTSFASGGLMDIGGQVMGRIMTTGQRREQKEQDKRTSNFQFQEGSRGQVGTSTETAGTYGTVEAALEAMQSGELGVTGTFATQADAEAAAAEITPTLPESDRPTWEAATADWAQDGLAPAAEETTERAGETREEAPAAEETVPAEWTWTPEGQTSEEILRGAAEEAVDARAEETAEAAAEEEEPIILTLPKAKGIRVRNDDVYRIDGESYMAYTALDNPDIGRFYVPLGRRVSDLSLKDIIKGRKGVIAEGQGEVQAEKVEYKKIEEPQEGAPSGFGFGEGPQTWAEMAGGRQQETQADADEESASLPAWTEGSQAEATVEERTEAPEPVTETEAPVTEGAAPVTEEAAPVTEAAAEETEPAAPAAAPVTELAEAPVDATEIRTLPDGEVIAGGTASTQEETASVSTEPQQGRTEAEDAGGVTRDRVIVDTDEGPTVREDADDPETAAEAAHIIPRVDTADAVAKAAKDIKQKPADDAEGHADLQEAGYAYEAAQAGIPLEQLGGVYVMTDARRAMVAAAYQRGEMDLAERTREIAKKNAEVAERSGFRDGGEYRQHTNGVSLEGVTRDLSSEEKIQLGVLESMGKRYGIDFRVYDNLKGKNALYRADSGQVDISLEAKGGLVRAASHELYHYVEQYSPDDADLLRDIVLQTLEGKAGYSLQTRIQDVTDAYQNAGEVDFDAVREIVADSLLDVLAGDSDKVAGAWAAADQSDTSFFKRTAEHIKEVGAFLRGQLEKIVGSSPETKALKDDAEYVTGVGIVMQGAMKRATAARQAMQYDFSDIEGAARETLEKYARDLEQGETTQTAQGRLQDGLALLLDKDGRILQKGRLELRQLVSGALTDFVTGRKSMQKALEDAGFVAPEGDTLRLAVYAARELEKAHGPQAVQEGAYKASITFDDGFEAMERAEGNFGDLDEGYEAAGILQKIFDIVKRGRVYKTQTESLQPGQWAPTLDALVQDIIGETGTKTAAGKIKTELRAMYTALDEALLSGQDFDVRAAVAYAKRIAEAVAEKAGTRVDTEDDMVTDFVKTLKGRSVYLSPAQAEEARRIYGSIRNLNKAYYGTATFTIGKTNKSAMMLEDMARENEVLFDGVDQEADLFNRLEELIGDYKGNKAGAVDYNGMDRRDFERDLTMRIVEGYFNLENGLVQQAGESTQAKTKAEERYVAAVKEMRKTYLQRMRALDAEYQTRTQEAADMTDQVIEEEKARFAAERRKVTEAYGYNALRIADALGEQLDDATRARLVAGVDFEEAHEAFLGLRDKMEAEIQRRSEERAQKLFDDVSKGAFKAALGVEMRRKADLVRDREARRALRNAIEKTTKKFEQQLRAPTDKSHAPEEMRGAFAKVLNLVRTDNPRYPGGHRTQHWQGIQDYLAVSGLLDQYADDTSAVWDENLKTNLQELQNAAAGKSIYAMSLEELRTLSEVMTSIRHTFENYDKMFTEGARKRVSEITTPVCELALQRQEEGKGQQGRTGVKRTIWAQLQGSLLDPIRWRNWADRMTGTSRFGTQVHGLLRDAQDHQIRMVKEAEGLFKDWVGKVSRKQLEGMRGKKAQTVALQAGDETVRITRGQLMSLYMLMQRPQAVGHILGTEIKDAAGRTIGRAGGGISIRTQDTADGKIGTTMPVQVTEEAVRAALEMLTPQERQICEGARKVLDWAGERGNEASMRLYGYKKFGEKGYFPIKTDSHYTSQTRTDDNANPLYVIKNMGFTKQLTLNANSPLQLMDIFDVVRDHTVGMINYAAWAAPLQDVTRVLDFKLREEEDKGEGVKIKQTKMTTSQALDILMGENAQAYINQLLKDINGITSDEIEAKAKFQNGLGKMKAGAVAYNLSTAVKQPWSITRAWGVVDPKYFVGARQAGCREKTVDLLEKYAPIYTWKQYGNFTMDMGKSMDQIFFPQTLDTLAGKINDKSMAAPGWADNQTWKKIWNACERQVADQHKDLTPGTEDYYRQVALDFREVIDQTQVVDGILQRTQVMRSKSEYIKILTSFMGEPLKSFNCLADAVEAIGQTEKGSTAQKQAKQYAARAATVYGVSSVTMAVVSSFVSAFRHLDPDEPWGETFMRYLTGFEDWDEFLQSDASAKVKGILGSNLVSELSLLNKLPYLRDVFSALQGYDAERSDVSIFSDIMSSAEALMKAIQGTGKKGLGKAITEFGGLMTTAFGVPIGNVLKEAAYLSNGIAQGVQKITGWDTFEWQYQNMLYTLNLDYSANANTYIGLIYRARLAGAEGTAQHIIADLIAHGGGEAMRDKIDKRLAKLYKADAAPQAREYMELMDAGKRDEAEKIRQGFGGGTETFDSAVQEEMQGSSEVAEANASRKAGNLEPMKELVEKYRAAGYDDKTIYKAINAQYNEGQADDEKVTAAAGSMWLAKDLGEAVDRGDLEDARYIVTWMQTEEGKAKGTVKSALTKQAKQKYIDAVERGDTLEAERIRKMLLDVGLGYTEKEITGWTKK